MFMALRQDNVMNPDSSLPAGATHIEYVLTHANASRSTTAFFEADGTKTAPIMQLL
jgi:hypothetical protein